MRAYSMSTQIEEGYTLHLYDDYPLWKAVVAEGWDKLCGLTGGWIGGHGAPEFFWKIPVGKPRRDPEDDWLENSLASLLWDLENWVFHVTDEMPHEVHKISLTIEQARGLDPDFVAMFEDES